MFTNKKEVIKQAVRQIERWIFASKQDIHPGIAFLHANYAVGDLDMIRQMFSDIEIYKATGKNALVLLRKASQLQDKAQKKLQRQCPDILVHA